MELSISKRALTQAADDVWNGNSSRFNETIFKVYNNDLHKAVSGLDAETEKLLKNNITRMSAAKTSYTVKLLEAEKAASADIEEFRKRAALVTGRANSTQAAEYNTAVHRTRVVKQWKQFEKESKLYPNIEWIRTRSANPREQHLEYAGRIWHRDDPFWNQNQPGCIWNCKCSWKTTDKPVTDGAVTEINASPGLEGNPAKTNEIFTGKHPYFKRADSHTPELGVLHNSDEIVYLNKADKAGNKFVEHFNCQFENEYANSLRAVEAINSTSFNGTAILLPRIHKSEIALRERYYGKAFQKANKLACPDAMIGSEIVEFKSGNRNTASKRILQGARKANIVYLEFTEEVTPGYLKNFAKRQWAAPDRNNLTTLIISNAGETKVFQRP